MPTKEEIVEFSKDYWYNFNPICSTGHQYTCTPSGLWCIPCERSNPMKEDRLIPLVVDGNYSDRFKEIYNNPPFHNRDFKPL